MSKHVFCIKLQKEAPGMNTPPFPGPLGEKIFNHVSQEAWNLWVAHQTMLINEYRLQLVDAQARQFLREELEKYFFGDGSAVPAGFTKEGA